MAQLTPSWRVKNNLPRGEGNVGNEYLGLRPGDAKRISGISTCAFRMYSYSTSTRISRLLSKDSQHAATNRKQLASTSTRMGTRKFVSRGVVRTITTNTDRTTDSLEGERGEIRCKLLPSAFPYCRASPALAISPCMPR
jgi:hypothetical protein